MYNIHPIIAVILALVAVVAWFLLSSKKETFYTTEQLFPTNTFYLSEYPTIMSNGTVQKTLLTTGEYLYEYFYNLPVTYSAFQMVRPGVAFNEKLPDEEYKVYAGQTKDKMEHIGSLKRRNDGYHLLTVVSKQDYKVTCITLQDKAIHCIEI